MKKSIVLLVCLAVFLAISCSTTSAMHGSLGVADDLSVTEKLDLAGFERVSISRPKVFYDGGQWLGELTSMIENAQDYIIMTVFLGSQCDENTFLLDLIRQKAESGIPVYLVYDGTGAFDMTESRFHLRPLSDLASSGIHLLEYHPFSFSRLVNLWNVIQREHRKFVVVDGNQIAIGGMNLNYISLGPLDEGGQRDSMYRFQSAELGAVLVRDFIDFWNNESWDEVSSSIFPIPLQQEAESITAWCANQYGNRMCMSELFGIMVNSAERSVLSLPFLPYSDKNMLQMLSEASASGIDVKMMIPFDSRPMPRKATSYMLSDIVKTGIEVRMEKPSDEPKALLHEKLLVIDERYICFGSSNFNYRSMNLSNEIMLVVEDEQFAAEVMDHLNKLMDDTYVLDQQQADSMRKLVDYPNFVFGFFGG